MHNPGMINIPRSIPLPLQPYGRMPPPPAADFIPIDMGHHHHHHHQQQHHHHQPHVYLAHRQPSRYRTHQSFSGNQFYNRTKRKRDSSNASRTNGASISVEGPAALDNRGDPEDDRTKIPKSTPWNPKGLTYTEGIIGLHEEIEAFVQWMVPTEAEHNLRLSVINRLRASIKEIYPEAVVQIFGSFRTGLYLPTSDIDLVLVGKWDQIPFEIVRRGIETKNLAKPGSLQLLEHATVPIIKMTDRLTDIKVDISFNMTNGLRSVELIKYFKKKFPAMAKLIYVLKQFLLQRDLNEVYTGGLSSYALILMVVSFLQLHPRGEEAGSDKANLGVLLIEFYELYGRHFNYTTTGIKISDGGSYVSKDEIRLKGIMTMGTGLGSLSIQDPYLPENDVGKSSYGIPVVKTAFEQAYLTLTKLVLPGGINYTNGESILSHVVRVSDEVITFRNWVASNSQGGEAAESAQSSSTTPPPASSTSASGPGKNDNNNEDQTLSEDPRLPTQITPTPSRDVLPRELPSKIFGGKDDQGGVEETTTAAPCVGKDTDNMSGVSTATSSESTTSQTDTDSDVLECRVGASSPSGSPSSAMSISPASSEVGIRNRLPRHNSGGHNNRQGKQAAASNGSCNGASTFRQPPLPGSNTGRGSGRNSQYWTSVSGGRKISGKERSDAVMNWRDEGPDKNADWRNHEPPVRPTSDRKNSWREEPTKNAEKSKDQSDDSSSNEKESSPPPPKEPSTRTNRDQNPATTEGEANDAGAATTTTTTTNTDQSQHEKPASSSEGSAAAINGSQNPAASVSKNEDNFIKSRTFNSKRRKKQRNQNRNNNNKNNNNNGSNGGANNTVNNNNNTINSTKTVQDKSIPDTEKVSNDKVSNDKVSNDKVSNDKVSNDKVSNDKVSNQNSSTPGQGQNRFSSKSGRSKPKR